MMLKNGIFVIDSDCQEQMNGGIDLGKGLWYIPSFKKP
jgi:hypothetical protein